MANLSEKTSSNIFYKARSEASKHNDSLSSREGAADIMSIDRGRLYRIESGITYPYPEEIKMMADLYNAPELVNHFCTRMCPLGNDMPQVDVLMLDRIALKALAGFKRINETKELLLDITADGIIDESEKDALNRVIETLTEIEHVTQCLKLWAKKNL